jgi:hypothetical protein
VNERGLEPMQGRISSKVKERILWGLFIIVEAAKGKLGILFALSDLAGVMFAKYDNARKMQYSHVSRIRVILSTPCSPP